MDKIPVPIDGVLAFDDFETGRKSQNPLSDMRRFRPSLRRSTVRAVDCLDHADFGVPTPTTDPNETRLKTRQDIVLSVVDPSLT